MLRDLAGVIQPSFGSQPHYQKLRLLMSNPSIFDPLQNQAVLQVANAIAANSLGPVVHSNAAGAAALSNIGSTWHAQFSRRYPGFASGDAAALFGMTLWNYLSNRHDMWCFVSTPDRHGSALDAKKYWRILTPVSSVAIQTSTTSCE